MELINYKMIVSYVGTAYCGWQVQPDQPTIQGTIESLLEKIYAQRIVLRYSSRTDSGVHAYGQVAGFKAREKFTDNELHKAINSQLPNDIVIRKLERCAPDFNPSKTLGKTYCYQILNSKVRDPFLLERAWWLRYELDLSKMENALGKFLGKKDFSSFMCSGTDVKTTIRDINNIDFKSDNGLVRIKLTANGFLKQMVRNIVGTVVDIGRGKIPLENLESVISACDRRKAGITAPAHGLFLERVYYAEDEKTN